MSNKKLLSESTVRRFMKLANTHAFSDQFVKNNQEEEVLINLKEMVDEMGSAYAKDDEDPLGGEEPGMEDDMGEEPEMEDDMGEEPGAADISLTEEEAELLIDLGQRLADAMPEGEDDMGEEPGMEDDMGEEPPMDDMGEEPPMDDMGGEPAEEEPAALQERLVKEVLRRVTKRMIKEKLKRS